MMLASLLRSVFKAFVSAMSEYDDISSAEPKPASRRRVNFALEIFFICIGNRMHHRIKSPIVASNCFRHLGQ